MSLYGIHRPCVFQLYNILSRLSVSIPCAGNASFSYSATINYIRRIFSSVMCGYCSIRVFDCRLFDLLCCFLDEGVGKGGTYLGSATDLYIYKHFNIVYNICL